MARPAAAVARERLVGSLRVRSERQTETAAPAGRGTAVEIDWLAFVAEAHREVVAAAVLTASRRRGIETELPDDVRAHLGVIHDSNSARNARIRQQCLGIGACLAEAGLAAVLLKGSAWLFDGHEDAASDRIMRDIDLLVPAGRLAEAAARLTAELGYRSDADFPETGPFYHLASLIPPRGEAAVELHRDISRWPRLLSAAEILRDARPVAPGLLMPSPAHRIVHNAVHAGKENGDWLAGIVSLRDTLDLARLAETHLSSLDWAELRSDARARGSLSLVSGAIHVAAAYLGSPVPAAFAGDRRGRFHAARCREAERRPALGRAFRALARAQRALDPSRDAYDPDGAGQGLGLRSARTLSRWSRRLRRSRWLTPRGRSASGP